MKAIAEALGVSRSNRLNQGIGPASVARRHFVDECPTYGDRCIAALVNTDRKNVGLDPVNRKRIHRIMASDSPADNYLIHLLQTGTETGTKFARKKIDF
jgi:hypothetical protein